MTSFYHDDYKHFFVNSLSSLWELTEQFVLVVLQKKVSKHSGSCTVYDAIK